jgi:hypothetical protein
MGSPSNPALEALDKCEAYYVRFYGIPVDSPNITHHPAVKEMYDSIAAGRNWLLKNSADDNAG